MHIIIFRDDIFLIREKWKNYVNQYSIDSSNWFSKIGIFNIKDFYLSINKYSNSKYSNIVTRTLIVSKHLL